MNAAGTFYSLTQIPVRDMVEKAFSNQCLLRGNGGPTSFCDVPSKQSLGRFARESTPIDLQRQFRTAPALNGRGVM